MEYTIYRLTFRVLLFIGAAIAFCFYIFRRKTFIYNFIFKKELVTSIYRGRHDLFWIRVGNLLLLVGMLFICSFLVDVASDLPCIIQKNYLSISGYTVGKSTGGADVSYEKRSVDVYDEKTKKVVRGITVFYNYIEEGTYVEVEYLPNTKYGAINYMVG